MAWMSIDRMREEILRVYPEELWKWKVSQMPDKQVAAIYNRMLNNRKLKKIPVVEKKPDISYEKVVAEAKKFGEYTGEQIRIDI